MEPNDGYGVLNTLHGDTVVFTLLGSPKSKDDQPGWTTIAIKCRSFIPGVSDAGTNGAARAAEATDEAYVNCRTVGDGS